MLPRISADLEVVIVALAPQVPDLRLIMLRLIERCKSEFATFHEPSPQDRRGRRRESGESGIIPRGTARRRKVFKPELTELSYYTPSLRPLRLWFRALGISSIQRPSYPERR